MTGNIALSYCNVHLGTFPVDGFMLTGVRYFHGIWQSCFNEPNEIFGGLFDLSGLSG